jgi:hypothetical protein
MTPKDEGHISPCDIDICPTLVLALRVSVTARARLT